MEKNKFLTKRTGHRCLGGGMGSHFSLRVFFEGMYIQGNLTFSQLGERSQEKYKLMLCPSLEGHCFALFQQLDPTDFSLCET